jgi:dienelactone hydrolase
LNKNIDIKIGSLILPGILNLPRGAKSLIVFAHGSGSSRLSPRNNFVAEILQKNNFATLLFDLLTEKEDEIYENRFDIDLIAKRLIEATEWLLKNPETSALAIGYFGASTGSAAAIKAAIVLKKEIKAVVSRGGRVDLAEDVLEKLSTPILLIVGGSDEDVIELNQKSYEKIKSQKKIEIIPGASHLFEEPGALEKVADIAAKWFSEYLR